MTSRTNLIRPKLASLPGRIAAGPLRTKAMPETKVTDAERIKELEQELAETKEALGFMKHSKGNQRLRRESQPIVKKYM